MVSHRTEYWLHPSRAPEAVWMTAAFQRWSYEAFGLVVTTDFELPELPQVDPSPEGPDVVVERGTVDSPPELDPDRTFHYESPTEQRLLYPVANVLVESGRRIVVDPVEDAPPEVVRHLLVGPAMNFLLHQRNVFVLHASTVSVDGAAVAFAGESGRGKTTTATAFLRDGHRVLSDDVAAITFEGGSPAVRSGYPSIKLDPGIVKRWELPVEEPHRPSSARDRHFYGLCHDQPTDPVPLKRVYLLEDGDEVGIDPLPPGEQFVELVANTYVAGILGDGGEATVNFGQCTSVARTVDVCRLYRPRELDTLSDVVEAVRADVDRR